MANIVLVTKGTYGDVVPFLALGSALVRRGNTVTLISQCEYRWAADREGISFESWDTPAEYKAFIDDGPLLDGAAGLKEFADRHIFTKIEPELEVIHRHCNRSDTVFVVRHMGSLAAWFAAELSGHPLVSVFTAVAQKECLPLLAHAYQYILGDAINRCRESYNLQKITDWKEWLMKPGIYLGCWPNWFAEDSNRWPHPLFCLGFLRSAEAETGELPEEVSQMASERAKYPVLITGGTAKSALSDRFYRVAVDTCVAAGRPAILVCRHDSLVPASLPADIRTYHWLPFGDAMPRTSAVIHHGGTSVMVRAMEFGLPQLLLPFGADRPDTAYRLERIGVGKRVLPPNWSPPYLATVLNELIESSAIRQACEKAQRDVYDGVALDCGCAALESLADR